MTADSLPQDEGGEEDGDQDAQLVDGDDHADGTVLEDSISISRVKTRTAPPEAATEPSSPRGIQRNSLSVPVTVAISHAMTRTALTRNTVEIGIDLDNADLA